AKFADVDTLEITSKAARDAQKIGYSLEGIVDVVQALEPGDFIKSETAHNPPNHRIWHDTYNIPCDGLWLRFEMSETRIHPETGQELRRDTRPQTVRVGSLSRVVDVPGWYPEGDGDAIHSGADLRVFNEAFK
ncbi:hypothetical protein E4T56_gene5744, partial [Termitomyces sp. T112]